MTRPSSRGERVAALLAVALVTAAARAHNRARMDLQLSGAIEIEGDSTLKKWRSRTRDLRAVIEAGAAAEDLAALARAGQVTRLELAIPVAGFASGDGTLDRHLRKALSADAFPAVRFVADEIRAAPNDGLTLRGRLELAGAARPVVVDAHASARAAGLRLTGQKELLMTDFGIAPPTLMLGALKTSNRVLVRFDVEARVAPAAPRPISDRP